MVKRKFVLEFGKDFGKYAFVIAKTLLVVYKYFI